MNVKQQDMVEWEMVKIGGLTTESETPDREVLKRAERRFKNWHLLVCFSPYPFSAALWHSSWGMGGGGRHVQSWDKSYFVEDTRGPSVGTQRCPVCGHCRDKTQRTEGTGYLMQLDGGGFGGDTRNYFTQSQHNDGIHYHKMPTHLNGFKKAIHM